MSRDAKSQRIVANRHAAFANVACVEASSRWRVLAAIALCRRRLAVRPGARAGWALAAVAAALVVAAGASLPEVGVWQAHAILGNALRLLCWVGAGPVALAAASDLSADDRRDGVALLAFVEGFDERVLEGARMAAAMIEATLRIAVPGLAALGMLAALGRAPAPFAATGSIVLAALLGGVVLGGLGAACGRLGGPRGRWLLAALIFLPWVVADAWAAHGLSIPDLIDAGVDSAVDLQTGGA
jgi:hypothetical protein